MRVIDANKGLSIGLVIFCIGLVLILISMISLSEISSNLSGDMPLFQSVEDAVVYVSDMWFANSEMLLWNFVLYIGIFSVPISIIIGVLGVVFERKQRTEIQVAAPRKATQEVSVEPKPVDREVVVEKERVRYIRCDYCKAKVLETETKCPNCGAEL